MSHASDTFFTAVGCMDGRVQAPIAAYGQKKFNVKYPDTITEAGLVGQLAKGTLDKDLLRFKVIDVSLGKHHAAGIIVHGHQECAGNPIDDETHKQQTKDVAALITAMLPEGSTVPVIPVFVVRQADEWVVEEL
jgi:carbonic anhydrase